MERLTFLIASPFEPSRVILRQMIASHNYWLAVAEAEDGAQTVQLGLLHRPHLILIDVDLPILSGLEATRQIRPLLRETRIIMFSTHCDEEFVRASRLAGSDYYLEQENLNRHTLTWLAACFFPESER